MGQCYNSVPAREIVRDPSVLSQELLVLLFLTLLGYSFPVQHSYNPNTDKSKTWSRELMLRVIKGHGPVSKN